MFLHCIKATGQITQYYYPAGGCRDVVIKHADSHHKGCQFDSSMCHNKIAIGEEGNGKPPHEIHFPRENSDPCLWFLLHSKWSMRRSSLSYKLHCMYYKIDIPGNNNYGYFQLMNGLNTDGYEKTAAKNRILQLLVTKHFAVNDR